MVFIHTLVALALSASVALGAIDGPCHFTNGADGVCVTITKCNNVPGSSYQHGRCPNDPPDVKCCRAPGCKHVQHGRCPGGENIKWVTDYAACYYVEHDKCPGGTNFKKVIRRYP